MSGKATVLQSAKKAHKAVWGRKAPWAIFSIKSIKKGINNDDNNNNNDSNNDEVKVPKNGDDIYERQIIAYKVGKKTDTLKDLLNNLDNTQCFFVLFDHKSKGKFGKVNEKTHFIFWSPPNTNQQTKMMYSAYLINFRDEIKYAHHLTFQDKDDFDRFKDVNDNDDDDDDDDDDIFD